MFILTDLGVFRSGYAAREAWLSQPHNGPALVLEERDLFKYGVCYGIEQVVV